MVLMWIWGPEVMGQVGGEGTGSGVMGQGTHSYLLRLGEQLDDARVGHGHHTLPVDLDDAVSHADTPALGSAPTQQAADLRGTVLRAGPRLWASLHPTPGLGIPASRCHPPHRSPAARVRGAGG